MCYPCAKLSCYCVSLHLSGELIYLTPILIISSYVPRGDYNTQGLGKEHFTHLLPGSLVHLVHSDDSDYDGAKSHPIVAMKLVTSNSSLDISRDDEMIDSEEEDTLDTSSITNTSQTFIGDEDEDGLQFMNDSDDSDEDPDRDDLQTYLQRVAKSKDYGNTNTKKSPASISTKSKESKMKVVAKETKRKMESKQVVNKKIRTKK